MNRFSPSLLALEREAAQTRFSRRIVAHLNEGADGLPPDVVERLRFAREGAVERARLAVPRPASVVVFRGGAAALGGGVGWGWKLASAAPLVALVCGLVLIQQWQTRTQISAAAEVDAALLSDDLPPTAYRDAGFVEFLKSPPRE